MPAMSPMKCLRAQALSMSAPSGANAGIDVSSGRGVACVLSAESGRTITGGTMRGYVYMPVDVNEDGTPKTWRWFRHAALDWTPATGARDAASGDFQVFTGVGRVAWVTDAVTVSGGTTVDVTMLARRNG